MKVSKRATYGIMVAVDLAMHANEAPIQARAIMSAMEFQSVSSNKFSMR